MKSFKSPPRLFFYLTYGVILTFVLLYIRFPTEKFKTFWEQKVEQTFSNSVCSIDKIHYAFPAFIVFDTLKISKTAGEQAAVIVIDQLRVRPGIRFWNTFILRGELYTGTVKAALNLDKKENGYKLTDIMLYELKLSEIIKHQGIVDRNITGSLSGSGKYQAQWNAPGTGLGKMRIAASSGSLELLHPVLSLSTIDFEQVNFDVSIGEQVEIQQGKLKGKDLNGDFEGTVNVMNSFFDSRVSLSGLLEPRREFLQTHPVEAKMVKQYAKRFKRSALPFKMGGTLSNPTFRLSR